MKASDFFKFFLWEFINPRILKLKAKRMIRLKADCKGINLGCGFDNPAHWLGLDGGASLWMMQKSPRFLLRRFYKNFKMADVMDFDTYYQKVKTVRFIHHDIRFGLPFRDESVPHVFSSHFLEHLEREEARKLLKDCYRVMKKGGIIRIVVPSLDEAADSLRLAYENYKLGNTESIQKFVTDRNPGFLDRFSGHKWMYNFTELKNMMEEAGFREVKECDFQKGEIPDVEKLDCRVGIITEGKK